MRQRNEDDAIVTPPAVVCAVSIGTAPLPFLAVYAVLFIAHGTFAPAHPPDITSSQTGELIAGIVAGVIFVVLAFALWLFLNARLRWPFVVSQAIVLGVSIWFLTDETKGGAAVSMLLVATSIVALACGFAPDGWRHVGANAPQRVRSLYRETPESPPAGERSALPLSGDPTLVEPAALRHRHDPYA